jgi:tetratricopeptide (TPR) repeat protein
MRTYLDELASHANHAMSQRPPAGYPVPLAAALRISVRELDERSPDALQLLYLCAPMAAEPVPLDLLFPQHRAFDVGADAALLARLGLARLDPDGLRLHRLTQAILLDQLDPRRRDQVVLDAEKLLVDRAPETSDDPAEWPRWSRLLPHILARNPAASDNMQIRELATDAVRYLLNRGETAAGWMLAESLVESWRTRYGPDDPVTLNAAYHLARALREQGEHDRALRLARDVLDRYRRLEGPDARSTLAAATGVAASLRALDRPNDALAVDRDILARKRRVLGDDDPSTLASAVGVGTDLRELGRLEEAEEIDRATLASKERVLGPDALATLASLANLATDLRLLGRVGEAVTILHDLVSRSARVLGDDHPTTLAATENLQALRKILGSSDADQH